MRHGGGRPFVRPNRRRLRLAGDVDAARAFAHEDGQHMGSHSALTLRPMGCRAPGLVIIIMSPPERNRARSSAVIGPCWLGLSARWGGAPMMSEGLDPQGPVFQLPRCPLAPPDHLLSPPPRFAAGPRLRLTRTSSQPSNARVDGSLVIQQRLCSSLVLAWLSHHTGRIVSRDSRFAASAGNHGAGPRRRRQLDDAGLSQRHVGSIALLFCTLQLPQSTRHGAALAGQRMRSAPLTRYPDKLNKSSSSPPKTPAPAQPLSIPTSSADPRNPQGTTEVAGNGQANGHAEPGPSNAPSTTRRLSRSASIERQNGPSATPLQRRNSWFSNISAKFSSSSSGSPPSTPPSNQHSLHHIHHVQLIEQQQQAQRQEHLSEQQGQPQPQSPPRANESPPPRLYQSRNAVLQHVSKPDGDGPYTPAPPKSGQAGILGVFRRLSSSGGSGLANAKLGNGLVERMTLNVDQNRERCPITELRDAKLRRVSFCVDVEIAPMPKYAEGDVAPKPVGKTQKKKVTERGEGEALKNPKAVEAQNEAEVSTDGQVDAAPKEPETQATDANATRQDSVSPPPDKERESTKKKEKKKKSEEERKARKEKRRRLAEDNGSVPMEIHYDSDDSSSDNPSGAGTPRSMTTTQPTTNPARIYRRCCQLRETPILKKITEQLSDSANSPPSTGIVNRLDLTDYWLQLPDLVTLGDYLAVVPVREIVLENAGLSDEGLRVILAGLLAAKRPPSSRRRKPKQEVGEHGGVVERVVLKNNRLGPDGWKHISLFLYMCRSLKYLDLSHIPFPRQAPTNHSGTLPNGQQIPRSISDVFSRSLADRLGGSTLEMLNIGETEPSMDQLTTIMDGIITCGVRRLGLAHNYLDEQGVALVAKYLAAGKCEGLDVGGNDLKDHMETFAGALKETHPLWALSLAGCNLNPSSLCKILPTLVKLNNFRFIDLSHNQDLFQSTPSAVGLLRRWVALTLMAAREMLTVCRYLPKMECLKRIHLQDVNMTSEQAIAIVEVLPEVHTLAHINLLGNAELVKLAGAKTEEAQEEACALYASLLAATRISKTLICVDMEVPGDESGEIVKAMAKQVVAYCLRNMERMPDTDIGAAVATASSETQSDGQEGRDPPYPDVVAHLVGHDVLDQNDAGEDNDSAPDEDYVIGGTGVVKALACCLRNRGDESRRQSGEFTQEMENGETSARPSLATGGKAKDMSKHLLAGARKIRIRLQPALNKAKANPGDEQNLRKLTFLDETLQGIIKRFEDEFPDTREPVPEATANEAPGKSSAEELSTSVPTGDDSAVAASDGEDESSIHPPKPLSRSNSVLSKTLAEEEGRMLRAGHRFRSGLVRQEQIDLLSSIDDMDADLKHAQMLEELAEDLDGELLEKVREKGAARAFKEDKDVLFRSMRDSDPDHWVRFVEAQQKARANIIVSSTEKNGQ
ncbi:MAP-homologous protein 1 [Tolypocladium paradoxum]|uniref:MAP-homologous protein 1 n=1 Tax=Tolypocladium paradoxum TaxID=94208 RepID=A0A2S4KNL0_9HYPO|nr:MAP-homologous protein 1 [Tolypocladium paradoxum]